MNEALLARVRECSKLPSLPGVAIEVLQITQDKSTDIVHLAKIVSKDPALTARVLRTVNSSYYGLSQQVSNLDQAMALIGLRTVKVLVLGFSLVTDLMHTASGGLNLSVFWKRSFYAAAAARALANDLSIRQADTCFLVALLMDVGMLALDQALGTEYAAVVAKAPNHPALCDLEREAFDLTHADVSGALAEIWKLPAPVREPLRCHHRPQAAGSDAVRETAEVVSLASRCADVFVETVPVQAVEEVRRVCGQKYKISDARCDDILCAIGQAGIEFCTLIDMPSVSPTGVRAVATVATSAPVTDAAPAAWPSAEPAGSDKRRAPRIARQGSILITPCFGAGAVGRAGEQVRVQFRDLSRNGIGLLFHKPLPVGTQFIVSVPRGGGETVPIVYVVVRCIPKGPNLYEIGAQVNAIHRQAAS
jgi:HD-like signal output (HDOD) protein